MCWWGDGVGIYSHTWYGNKCVVKIIVNIYTYRIITPGEIWIYALYKYIIYPT
jgi:hypothetical protein